MATSSSNSKDTPPPTQQTPFTAPGAQRRLQGWVLGCTMFALMLTLFLEALDQTIVSTAMPKIISVLNGYDLYTWGITSYLLASTSIIPIAGKLSDQFGRKWLLISGVAIFLFGSALSGTSTSMIQLIVFRAIQGLGAGMGISLIFTVVGDIFTPVERARWQGLFAAVYGVSSVIGPTAGGWLTDHGPLLGSLVTSNTRWHWVFYINIPLGIIALVLLLAYLPANISQKTMHLKGWAAVRRFDIAGAFLASGATICLLLGLTWGGETYPWNSPNVIITLSIFIVLFAAFLVVERFAVEPILPFDLFQQRIFSVAATISLITGMVLLSLVTYLPLFLQGILNQTATSSGAIITPLTISSVIGSALVGQLIHRLGRYRLVTIIGAVILTVGAYLLTRLDSSSSIITAIIAMTVTGVGLGMFFPIPTLTAQNAIPRNRLGVGTGAIIYLRATGQILGLAIVGTVVNNVTGHVTNGKATGQLANKLPEGANQLGSILVAATNPQVLVSKQTQDNLIHRAVQQAAQHQTPAQQITDLMNHIFQALRDSLAAGIIAGFVIILVFCVALLIAAFLLKDISLRKTWG